MKKIIALIALAVFLLPYQITRADDTLCSCVRTARWLGAEIPMVDAVWFQHFPSQMPSMNGLILLQYGDVSHVAVIKGFRKDGFLISEGNYKRCQLTTRILPYDSDKIRGFWHS